MSDADDGTLQGEADLDRGRRPRPELRARGGARRRSCCCSASPASCCSSPARTSPTCCSRAARRRAGEMAVRLSIGAGRGSWSAQLLDRVVLLALPRRLAGLVVAQLDARRCIGAAARRSGADASTCRCSRPALLFAAALCARHRPAVRAVPGAAQHAARSGLDAEGPGRPAVGRARGGALPHVARDGADRAVDGAARVGRALHQEPAQRQPRRSRRSSSTTSITFGVSPELNGYKPERSRRVVRARSRTSCAALPGVTGVTASTVPLLAGSNWGNSVAVEGFEAGPDTDTDSRFNEVGARLLPHARRAAARRPRVHAQPTRSAPPRSRSSTRRSRRSSTSAATRSASAWDRASGKRSSTSRSSAWCRTRSTAR